MRTLEQVSEHVDELMHRYAGPVPGASLLIVRDGEPVIRKAWGRSDLQLAVTASPETSYRLASVTKQFTAAAVLILAQDGKVSIEDPVSRWLPSLPSSSRSATLRHLLTHTSGMPDYEDLVPEETTRQLRDADVLELLESHDTSYFPAGTAWRYSNSGYALLALVVERASGRTFAVFLNERVFVPLGMTSSVAHEEGVSRIARRAYGYSRRNGEWVRNDQSVTSAVLGDGGIYSTVDDLAQWDAALYDSRLLTDESRRLAFTPHTATDDPAIGYGFGWRISGEMLWHSGETAGFRSLVMRNPSRRVMMAILTNRDGPLPEEMMPQMFGWHG